MMRPTKSAEIRAIRTGSKSRGFIFASTVMLAVTTAIASITLWPIYQDLSLPVLIVVTFALGSLIAILGAVYHWSSFTVLLVAIGAYFAAGVPVAVPGLAIGGVLPSFAGLKELFLGTATSWKQLVTISAPVGNYGILLVPSFILILVTVVVSLSLAIRSRFGDLAVLGPIVIFVIGILFGPDRAVWPFQVTFALITSVLLWLIWSRWYRRRESIRKVPEREVTEGDKPVANVEDGGFFGARTLLSAAIILVIAGTSSFAAVRVFPPINDRVVIRNTIAQPFDARNYPSPLSGFRRYEQASLRGRTIFSVSGLPPGARIRIATLDSYDGVVYAVGQGSVNSASGAFTRVPRSVDQSRVKGDVVSITFVIGDYDGVWMPTVGKLESVDFIGQNASTLLDSFYYNRSSDTAAILGGLSPGAAYSLTTIIPVQPSVSSLSTLNPGTIELQPSTSVPDELATALEGYVAGVTGAGNRLVAMLDGVKRDGYVSHGVEPSEPESRSGHSADRITELLTAQRMIGDQEQYAVTAALMARQLGFPARVVFGFDPQNSNVPGPTIIRGSDVSAWIEVDTTEYGWVAIDPTPPLRPIPEAEPKDPAEVAKPQSPVQPQVPATDSIDSQVPPSSSQDDDPLENPMLILLLKVAAGIGWAALASAILISPFLTIAIAKWRRRRLRRRAPTPLQQIKGGWEEFEDSVRDHGFDPGPAPTRLEVAQTVGGTQPFVLAAVADRAVFSPAEPDREQAVQLWTAVDDLRYALDFNLTKWQRLKVLISLRSLGGYSVSNLFKREGNS